ncbi:hypothetical protein CSW24_06565 [Thermus scotoductus]|nr:hypothetical protein CSW24_06565 [Thermus scotoductus]
MASRASLRTMPRWIALLVLLGLAWAQYDLVVYGATPQGVAAAVAAPGGPPPPWPRGCRG